MKTPESYIKDKIRAWLREQGAYVFSPTQMGYGQQTLDLLVCFRSHFIAIEVKAPGNKPTQRQKVIASDISAAGGDPWLCESLDEAKAYLRRYTGNGEE